MHRPQEYYRSEKALGVMCRAVWLEDPTKIPPAPPDASLAPLVDAMSATLDWTSFRSVSGRDKYSEQLTGIFIRYVHELHFICATHTLSHRPEVHLTEEEVVAGTILAQCSQKSWRKSRTHNMHVHTSALVHDIQREILQITTSNLQKASCEELMNALQRAHFAWELGAREGENFGGNSFGFIALGIIFDCIDALDQRKT